MRKATRWGVLLLACALAGCATRLGPGESGDIIADQIKAGLADFDDTERTLARIAGCQIVLPSEVDRVEQTARRQAVATIPRWTGPMLAARALRVRSATISASAAQCTPLRRDWSALLARFGTEPEPAKATERFTVENYATLAGGIASVAACGVAPPGWESQMQARLFVYARTRLPATTDGALRAAGTVAIAAALTPPPAPALCPKYRRLRSLLEAGLGAPRGPPGPVPLRDLGPRKGPEPAPAKLAPSLLDALEI